MTTSHDTIRARILAALDALTVMHAAAAGLTTPQLGIDPADVAAGMKRAALDAHDLLAPIATAPDAVLDWCPEGEG